jgi:hypothetical protein
MFMNVSVIIVLCLFQDILTAIEKDASETMLDQICGRVDSYGGGKEIGMLSRLASISRAFNTNHYLKLDTSIKNCLEKWLRIQGITLKLLRIILIYNLHMTRTNPNVNIIV